MQRNLFDHLQIQLFPLWIAPREVEVSLTNGLDVHVDYEWEIEYWDWFNHKFKSVIKPMQELAQKYEDVRYVFGFDN